MPLHALIEGRMTRADKDGPRRAACFECGNEMIAKTGDIQIWHWAHKARNPECGLAAETEWHLTWKACGLPGTQEVWSEDRCRRADILTPAGIAVEFQHSSLPWDEVRDRQADWDHRLVWVFDARTAWKSGRIEPTGAGVTWWSPVPRMVLSATSYGGCRTFLDLGEGVGVFYVAGRVPLLGPDRADWVGQALAGWAVSAETFIANVLHAPDTHALAGMSLLPRRWPAVRLAVNSAVAADSDPGSAEGALSHPDMKEDR